MRKVSFFNWKRNALLWVIVWGMLANKAVEVNLEKMRKEKVSMGVDVSAAERNSITAAEKAAGGKSGQKGAGESAENVETSHLTRKEADSSSAKNPDIRVLLMTTGYESYEHEVVSGVLSGEAFRYTADSPELNHGDMPLRLDGGTEGIVLTSIERRCGQPLYYGTIEISRKENKLVVINELPLETYLASVVPSEMPASYAHDALMAQAVCARTYAWKQMQGEGVKGYSADLDDSVNNQVYANISPQEATTRAVNDTAGEILTQNGVPVEAYYFSTSAGVTSTDEIWGAEESASYLKSVECSFDSGEPWSRWEVTLPWTLVERRAQSKSGSSDALFSIEIRKKAESGAVTELSVITGHDAFTINGEYAVREFFSPQGLEIKAKDDTTKAGGFLLPSAYFEMDVLPGEKIRLIGGGYGHGVGMSQNAANEMAREGYTCREILTYFFRNVEITKLK